MRHSCLCHTDRRDAEHMISGQGDEDPFGIRIGVQTPICVDDFGGAETITDALQFRVVDLAVTPQRGLVGVAAGHHRHLAADTLADRGKRGIRQHAVAMSGIKASYRQPEAIGAAGMAFQFGNGRHLRLQYGLYRHGLEAHGVTGAQRAEKVLGHPLGSRLGQGVVAGAALRDGALKQPVARKHSPPAWQR